MVMPARRPTVPTETLSTVPLKVVYRAADVDLDYRRDLGDPGEYPFTRGIHPDMYRGRLWTMRQFAGFGTAEDANKRFHYLLAMGQTGLSVAFDMPTLMGYDSDHPRALGEVGREGVAIDSLADMEILLDGLPLDRVTTSMTINAPANVLLALYVAVADARGIPRDQVGGTTQTDMLKEFIAQKEWIVPPRPSMKLIQDMLVFGARELPKWNIISISGYHMREAGATAAQELAFTLADGIAYVQAGIDAGLPVDEFAHRLFLGEDHARAVWRAEPALLVAALPHPDRWREPDRAAAAEQHRPRGPPGPGGGAGRHAVAAHQLHGRDLRPAHARGRDRGPAHAADHRP